MSRSSRPMKIAGVSLALSLLGAGIAVPQMAFADPATIPAGTTFSSVGAFNGIVPAGACFVQASVLGGAGGKAQAISNSNGAGANISATFPVIVGQTFSGSVGGGGASVATGGVGGGGAGGVSGTNTHPGAGGGGLSQFGIDSTLAILAGGGGGSSGGHTATTEGFGGDGGLATIGGVAAAGTAGTAGRDGTNVVGGGGAGTANTPGNGGTHSTDSTLNGTAGAGNLGGNGGADTNADTGGGGGGGYFGGGGGASTVDQGVGGNITGGGGGGGSSFVSTDATNIVAVSGPKLAGAAQAAGTPGSVSLAWVGCDYDLAVVKTVSAASTTIGDTITWSVAITNAGPEAMTQGDTVSLTDSLPGAGAKTITAISTFGGSNTELARGPVSCDSAVGAAMPATLECSRDFQILAGVVSGKRGLDVGETLTVTYTQVAAGAVGAVLSNQATVTDRATGDTDDTSTVTTTLIADPPVATDDSNLGNTLGTTVNVPVLGNDTGTIVASSLTLWDPIANTPITSPYVVAGEGTWTVETSGIIRFTPEAGFLGDPTPVTYQVTDANGLTDTATVTVTYKPVAANDSSTGNKEGDAVTVSVIGNDAGIFDPTSVVLIDPTNGTRVTTLVVKGEGTWTVNAVTGAITFTPENGFKGDPTPVRYEVTNESGNVTSALATVQYVHPAAAVAAAPGKLAYTGSDLALPAGTAGVLLLGGLALLFARFRRTRRSIS